MQMKPQHLHCEMTWHKKPPQGGGGGGVGAR